MTVYVDDSNIPADVPNAGRVIRSKWSHLMADDTEELVAFAVELGLRPFWIQHEGRFTEHFDVTSNKRRQAIKQGATPITWRESVYLIEAKAEGKKFKLKKVRKRMAEEDD